MISCLLVIVIEKKNEVRKREREKADITIFTPIHSDKHLKGKEDRALSIFLDVAFSRGFARFQALSEHWLDLLHSQRQTSLN